MHASSFWLPDGRHLREKFPEAVASWRAVNGPAAFRCAGQVVDSFRRFADEFIDRRLLAVA